MEAAGMHGILRTASSGVVDCKHLFEGPLHKIGFRIGTMINLWDRAESLGVKFEAGDLECEWNKGLR